MVTSLVVTVIGPDRPGIVSLLSAKAQGFGANWAGSRMASLAGQFAGMVHFEVPPEHADALAAALRGLESAELKITIERSEGAPVPAGRRVVKLELVGHDRPGIVRDLSGALAQRGVSIEELHTEIVSGAMTAEHLFKVKAVLLVPKIGEQRRRAPRARGARQRDDGRRRARRAACLTPLLKPSASLRRFRPVDFIFMLTRHDRTVEDALELVDAVCDLGVTHIGFKDIGVTEATMRELVAMIDRRGGTTYLEVVSTTPESVARSLAAGSRARRRLRAGRHRSRRGAGASSAICAATFPFPGRPVGPSYPPRRHARAGRRALRARRCDGMRRRRPPRLSRDRGRSAGARARGARRAAARALDRRRRRDVPASRSRRSPPRAWTRSRSGRPCSTARSHRPRDRSDRSSRTSWPPATARALAA